MIELFFYLLFSFEVVTFLRAEAFMITPPNPYGVLRRKWFFAGYDMWIGTYTCAGTKEKGYWDKKAYWFPVPCVGLKYWRDAEPIPQPHPNRCPEIVPFPVTL